ncbi:MAG TPA: 5'-3' exonuclease H3TH domain-containing protein [Solirubrobacteraceae bacterium]|nr:5'-3' exonuclease H3TH domain-containing protein [Solirubrobacteraceae bacterium]
MPAPLLIADVPWLLYRSFFALPKSIVDEQGSPVNALLGTVNAVLALIDARLPARDVRGVVACMGAEQANYRVELYPAYHAHRDPMPEELAAQWEKAPRLLESLGWAVPTSADLEADDVMYSYARSEEDAGGQALLLTADRDLFGAVSERVAVVELRKGTQLIEVGPEQVRERYGVDPELVPDFIALRGDPSDGLPGAPGIGAKTAAELLSAHGSLEAVLAAAGAIEEPDQRVQRAAGEAVRAPGDTTRPVLRPRVAAALRDNSDLLLAFKRIATLQRIDVQRPSDRPTDFAGGSEMARELGMRRLAQRLAKLATA